MGVPHVVRAFSPCRGCRHGGILERSFFAVLASAVRSSLRRYGGHGRCTNRWMATAGAASSAAEPDASLDGGRLAQRLGEIAANAAPENVLEPALRAIVAESGAAAGALCFFDSRQELLRLAAEVGLSDDGCRQLRCVRRGAATGWDIPLHGLLNRRAYLIDSAAHNRYVPPLVEPAGAMRAVVCVPLHAGPNPLGSLILVAVAPRSFAERDIHALERPLGVLVKMIEATRRRGGEQTSRPASTPPPPPAANPDAADADRVQLLIASLAATERERSRLAAALEAAAAERAEEARVQAALEARTAERAAELARLTERLGSEQARFQAALEACAEERRAEVERLTERLQSALSREGEASRRVTELERELADLRRQREHDPPATSPEAPRPDRVGETPEPDVTPVTAVRIAAPQEHVVAVVDAGGVWPAAGPGGEDVSVISPADLAGRLEELAPGCVVANLAAPGALEAIAALRASGWTMPVRGCLAATAHAVPLGPVEVIRRPLDGEAIQRALGAHAGRGARVLIVGTDVDFFAALREALGRRGLSVSMAWDAHHVDDLLAMVRPDVALIDLALGSRDVRPIVARLAAVDPVPTAVLVLGTEPAAGDFSAAMTYPVVAARAVPLHQLLAKALGREASGAGGAR